MTAPQDLTSNITPPATKTDETSSDKNGGPDALPPLKTRSKTSQTVAWGFSLLSLLALGVAGFSLWFGVSLRDEAQRQKAKTEALLADIKKQQMLTEDFSKSIEQRHEKFTHDLEALDKKTEERFVIQEGHFEKLWQQNESIKSVLAELPSQRYLWRMIEVVQLQRSAYQFLKVQSHPQAAQTALEMSLELARPISHYHQMSTFVKNTQDTIYEIRSQSAIDAVEVAKRLDLLGNAMANLPFIKPLSGIASWDDKPIALATQKAKVVDTPWWQKLWAEVVHEFSTIVRIYPENQPFVPPHRDFFLRQSMALSVDTARNAVFQRNVLVYQLELDKIKKYLSLYYEPSSELSRLIKEIDLLRAVPLSVESGRLKSLVLEGEAILGKMQAGAWR